MGERGVLVDSMSNVYFLKISFALILLMGMGQRARADLDAGLLAYYSFDGEEPGWDCAGQDRDAVIFGPGNLGAGRRGDGLAMKGQTYLEIGNFSEFAWGTNFSVSLWFNWNGDQEASGGLITAGKANDASWQMRLITSEFGPGLAIGLLTENLGAFMRNFPTLPLSPGVWNHLALVYDGRQSAVYWNGSRVNANLPNSGEILARAAPLVIGDQFRGTLDEIRLYQRALSEDELRQLRRDEPGKPPAACLRPSLTPEQVSARRGPAISPAWRELVQLEAVSCAVLDQWVEMLRRDERAALEEALTRTSRRTLMWDALVQLQDPAQAVPDERIPPEEDPLVEGPCVTSVSEILRIWKKGERFFAIGELEKLLEQKKAWEQEANANR